jgi:hypothetical protein
MSYDKNIYYTPEAFGVSTVFDVDKSSGSYEFDSFVIWKDDNGRYYWDNDSGCSCPDPYDSADLSSVRQGTLRDAVNDARVWVKEVSWNDLYHERAVKRIEEFARQNGLA